MIRRPLLIAVVFALIALVLFAALARITKMTLGLERSERTALQRATHEENVRIALWRLDATLAELLAIENTRPASRFRSAAESTGLSWLGGPANSSIGVSGTPVVRARFEVGADRKLHAEPAMTAPVWLAALPIPQPPPRPAPRRVARRPVAPLPERAAVAEPPKENDPAPRTATPKVANVAEPPAQQAAQQNAAQQNSQQNVAQQNLQRNANQNVAQQNTQQAVPAAVQNQRAGSPKLEETPPPKDLCAELLNATGVPVDRINATCNESGQQSAYSQEALNVLSFQRRKELAQQSTLVRPADAPPGVEAESAFEARWMGGDLVLLRRARRGGEPSLQGTWLDWPALRALLLSRIAAVVPSSNLVPVTEGDEADPGRRLALLPARLVPGPMPETEPRDWTPVRLSVAAAWLAAVLGLVGVGSLLKGSVTLSQRRADFVSAVTHELRTPLTTFRLYTEMLRDGIVPAEERPSYLATLKSEADRLGHLVENVLAFSRLERWATAIPIESLTLGELLARVVPHLTERAAQAGLTLQVENVPELSEERVRVDLASVEQILLNLVDNACKYAFNSTQPALELSTSLRGRHAVVRLHDHGPGIDRRERRRIFRPFHRPAAQAAGSAPGVGLGLALSRRLARGMGGDLRLAASENGASFELWLRLTTAAA
ncbi:MAG TPA: HAMP domain-containing sensor histidine kinase [Thermoanaerobaculia bacterium]|jgi:signal transduction histidine kinase|nr:HAMP domain-containing sensor histidine kinase [Thermoanaerobaculia bacterium]